MGTNLPPLDALSFARDTDVSRETLDRLETFLHLLIKWQARINLVGMSTLSDPWRRHFLDSAQLIPLMPKHSDLVLDLGSGAGFPGLVLAILGVPNVHLVEADQRKIAFLREVATKTATKVTLHPCRIELMPPLQADVITARALAPLAQLVEYAVPSLSPRGCCLFLKGRNVETELGDVFRQRRLNCERFPSRSDASSSILRLTAIF